MIADKQIIERLKPKILAALDQLGQDEDIKFKLGHHRLSGDHFTIDLEALTVLPDGTVSNPDKILFEFYAQRYGLEPEDFGKKFMSRGSVFKISGINPKAPRYPVNAIKIADGSSWKFTVPGVKASLKIGVTS